MSIKNIENHLCALIKSSEAGVVEAQNELGHFYLNGEYVECNYQCALKWLTKAAEQGSADAQLSLGGCYNQCHQAINLHKKTS